MLEKESVKVIGISGPDGGGKGYLTSQAVDKLGIQTVGMVTTRPPRPNREEKICISIDEYNKLKEAGELVGDHINKGNNYAYRVSDLMNLSGGALLELNPVYQADLPEELEKHGIYFAGWIGLYGELDYLAHNMKNRDRTMSDEVLSKKLEMASDIMEVLERLASSNVVTIFRVGWENRNTMGQEFTQLVSRLLQDLR